MSIRYGSNDLTPMLRSIPGCARLRSFQWTSREGAPADDDAESRRSLGLFAGRAIRSAPETIAPGLLVCLTLIDSLVARLGAWVATATAEGLLVVLAGSLSLLVIWGYRIQTSLAPVLTTGDDPDPVVRALAREPFTSVDEAAERLGALEQLFRARGDRRAVFLTIYARVTREVATEIEADGFENPAWVAEYLVTFANLYREALMAVETGDLDALPGAWRLYFRTARTQDSLVLQQALLGINAHVNYDLALALQAVGVDGDRATKYSDHRRINDILARLAEDTPERLARTYAPGLPRLVDVAGPVGRRVWFLALAAGREVAWWAAVAQTASRFDLLDRALGRCMNTFSTGLAYLVLVPNGASHALYALAVVEGSPSFRVQNRRS